MDYNNKREDYYNKIRFEMIKYLPSNAKKILEVGCGNGVFAEVIKKQNEAEVWGIEMMPNEAAGAAELIDKVFTGTCEEHLEALPANYFDVIYFNDVLEHMVDPYQVLKDLKSKLSPNGVIISSIPNMRYHSALSALLFKKDWKYDTHGIMDFTHLRFFTKKSIVRMFEEAGYQIDVCEGINRTRSIKPILYNVLTLFTQRDIFYLQYATVAKK